MEYFLYKLSMVINTSPQVDIIASPTEDPLLSHSYSTFGHKEHVREIGPWSQVVLSQGQSAYASHHQSHICLEEQVLIGACLKRLWEIEPCLRTLGFNSSR